MNTFTFFKNSFFDFSTLHHSKNMPFWKIILYIFFLSAILSISISNQTISVVQNMQSDAKEISKSIPTFEIKDGALITSTTDGFIHQTNSIIFTFDPEGKRSKDNVVSDSIGNTISVGMLTDRLVISLPSFGAKNDLLGTPLDIPYTQDSLNGLSSQTIHDTFEKTTFPLWVKLLIFFFALYPTFINLIINLLIIAIGANLYTKIRLLKFTFLDCLKISTYCATLPTILATILQIIDPSFDSSILIIFVSLFIFFFALKDEKSIKKS